MLDPKLFRVAEAIRIPLLVCSYSGHPQGGSNIICVKPDKSDMAVSGWLVMPNNVSIGRYVHERAYVSGSAHTT